MLPNCINCSFSNTKTMFIASRRNKNWVREATTFMAGGHFINYCSIDSKRIGQFDLLLSND